MHGGSQKHQLAVNAAHAWNTYFAYSLFRCRQSRCAIQRSEPVKKQFWSTALELTEINGKNKLRETKAGNEWKKAPTKRQKEKRGARNESRHHKPHNHILWIYFLSILYINALYVLRVTLIYVKSLLHTDFYSPPLIFSVSIPLSP